ncbi:hypothetical protein [Xanthomonas hortorum]|uniref:hypothetical protein n=1 Tax=Xanthomonas hortorum TaxID=56454 RepID=UPI0032E931D7
MKSLLWMMVKIFGICRGGAFGGGAIVSRVGEPGAFARIAAVMDMRKCMQIAICASLSVRLARCALIRFVYVADASR